MNTILPPQQDNIKYPPPPLPVKRGRKRALVSRKFFTRLIAMEALKKSSHSLTLNISPANDANCYGAVHCAIRSNVSPFSLHGILLHRIALCCSRGRMTKTHRGQGLLSTKILLYLLIYHNNSGHELPKVDTCFLRYSRRIPQMRMHLTIFVLFIRATVTNRGRQSVTINTALLAMNSTHSTTAYLQTRTHTWYVVSGRPC